MRSFNSASSNKIGFFFERFGSGSSPSELNRLFSNTPKLFSALGTCIRTDLAMDGISV